MRLLALALLALSLLSAPARAQFVTGFQTQYGSTVIATCPLTFTPADDGCLDSLSANHIGYAPQFSSYAAFVSGTQLSGQTWGGGAQTSQLQPWNMPGIGSYAVGPWTNPASMPNAWDNPPTNCISTTITNGASTAPVVQCTTATAVTISGLSFFPASGTHANQCIYLRVQGNTSDVITNNYFKTDDNCAGQTSSVSIVMNAGTGAFTFNNNEIDGNCAGLTAPHQATAGGMNVGNTGGTANGGSTYHYNYFHNICNRPVSAGDGSYDLQYNVVTNWCLACSNLGTHGEPWEFNRTAVSCTGGPPQTCTSNVVANEIIKFNLIVPAVTQQACCTAGFYIGDGGRKGAIFTNTDIEYNTVISNPFSMGITAGSCTGGTNLICTITTAVYSAQSAGANIIVSLTGSGIPAGITGPQTVASVGGGSTCTPTCTITYNTTASGTPTITGGTLQGPSMGTVLVSPSGAQFGTLKVASNYADTTGGLFQTNVSPPISAYECLLWGNGGQSVTGYILNSVWYVTSFAPSSSNGLIIAGEILAQPQGGSGLNGTFPVVQAFGTTDPNTGLASTGQGGTGSYVLNGSPPNVASSGSPISTFVYLSNIPTYTIPPSGGAPHAGGTQNWSLTANNAITGYTRIDNTGSPVCN